MPSPLSPPLSPGLVDFSREDILTQKSFAKSYSALGTGGDGYLRLRIQSSNPTAPIDGVLLFLNAAGNLSAIDSAGTIGLPVVSSSAVIGTGANYVTITNGKVTSTFSLASCAFDFNGEAGISTATPIAWAGASLIPRIRLRRPDYGTVWAPPPDFLITPYEFGMALEYPGTLEAWCYNFAVKGNFANGIHADTYQPYAAPMLWCGDNDDTGGVCMTAQNAGHGTGTWAEISSQTFPGTGSHGPLRFRVVSASDSFQFRQGVAAAGAVDASTVIGTVTSKGDALFQSFAGPATVATTSLTGSAFTNQPANDFVTIVSDAAGDVSQHVYIIGTTTGTDTVVVEDMVLNGVVAVKSTKADWGIILAVKKLATTAGITTVAEFSGGLAITTLAAGAGAGAVGVKTVTDIRAFNKYVSIVSDAGTTKQIGLQGTNYAGAVIYDSQALTGATAVLSNVTFQTLTEIYTGDVAVARTETVTAGLSGPDYAGTVTNDPTPAGKIGERLYGQLAKASATALVTATPKTITSVALTAGDWDVSGSVTFIPVNTTTVSDLIVSISLVDNTDGAPDSVGGYANVGVPYTSTGLDNTVSIIPTRISVAATTTVYLVANASFAVSTATAYGTIRARRMR